MKFDPEYKRTNTVKRLLVSLLSLGLFVSSVWAVQNAAESIAQQGQKYVLMPAKSTVHPTSVYKSFGDVEGEEKLLLDDGKAAE